MLSSLSKDLGNVVLSSQPYFSIFLKRPTITSYLTVMDPGKGVCADPVNRDAILGKGGIGPKGGNKERQLSSDRERDKT
jgi:hypothetical protein